MRDILLKRFIEQQPANAELSPPVRKAVLEALGLKGSSRYVTTHGAMSHIITTMLDYGMTAQVVPAVRIYSACFPTSLSYVLKSFPGKVSNYLCRHASAGAVMAWTEKNPDWSTHIISSVLDGTFDSVLYQMRTAVGAMTLNQPVLTMLRRLKDDACGISAGAQEQAQQILDKAPETLTQSPRQWNTDCNDLRAFILYFLLVDLEKRYGDMACGDRTFTIPFYEWQREVAEMPATGVVSFKDDTELAEKYDYGLCIGWRYDQWEQFFYQVALGAVYLLNPRIAPTGTLKTSTLEAGMAIRYAEEMLEKYLPYTGRALVDSPVGTGNMFDRACHAACKLPDNLLRQIREEFGSFGTITDPVRFAAMTSDFLTPDEALLLSSDFHHC
ncbi:hypothetical protein AE372_004156 [Salmonella enterica subsp. enterica serovar Colindale]|nr:hypothetical protein [Salmonella enterica subsp. enterica serovar Colindale]